MLSRMVAKRVTILYDFAIQMDKKIKSNRPAVPTNNK